MKRRGRWLVLLDAASYVSTCRLDLSRCTPDFVCMSFYKMFGFPTGLGMDDDEIFIKVFMGAPLNKVLKGALQIV